jgi:hypothetical protein
VHLKVDRNPLLPGEKRELTAAYNLSDLGKAKPMIEIDGWNVNRKTAGLK